MTATALVIRPYEPRDRSEVRRIFRSTAYHGRSFEIFFTDGEWLADIVTAYYTDLSPAYSYVAELDGRVVGYLNGTVDTAAFQRDWTRRILPGVIIRFLLGGLWLSTKNLKLLLNGVVAMFRRETRDESQVLKGYPAHFHVNVDPSMQARGAGTQLAAAFLERLKSERIAGVHVRTSRADGRHPFFERLGFRKVASYKLTVWKYLDPAPYELMTYVKELK